MITAQEFAERMKTDIVALVKAGTVPLNVHNFSQLHDYVDANCLGGSEALLEELDAAQPDTDEGHTVAMNAHVDLFNQASEIVEQWIVDRGVWRSF